ncbi:MAG TPA: helix-turn-helix domain-containing protein [Tepidiformaceae bacterium]|nr:helix-turn-helix domain-containing protein [Tepidiformaceae bacterium]
MHGIGLREAAEKYGIPKSTLGGWVNAGVVRKVQEAAGRGKPGLLFEPDVAMLAKTYKAGRRTGRGKKLSIDHLTSVA